MRKVSIVEAIKLARRPGFWVWWRPEPNLPEREQYALVLEA